MSAAGYSFGEIVFLLSLREKWALAEDSSPRSALANLTPDGYAPATSHEDWDPVPTFVRWSEVQRAKERVTRRRDLARELEVVAMRTAGFTEREAAVALGMSQSTVHRRLRATVHEIAAELGGLLPAPERVSTVSACMKCAVRPRARLAERRRRVRGGWKVLAPERLSSLCRECTPLQRRGRLIVARVNQDRQAPVGCGVASVFSASSVFLPAQDGRHA